MSYSVYVHKNNSNGKVYVGITSKKPEERWDYGCGYYSNKPFRNAIKKYGWKDGFSHAVVATGLTADEAAQIERKLIEEYDSNNREHGYNLTAGGFGYYGVQTVKKEIAILPEYSLIEKNNAALELFNELLSIAYGGKELKEETRYFRNGVCIKTEQITETTPPNKEAIRVILDNYENEQKLKDHITRLTELLKQIGEQ